MSSRKRSQRASPAAPSAPAPASAESPRELPLWQISLGALAALIAVFAAYGPALDGPFVFDDMYLPFNMNGADAMPLRTWLGVRPLLMFTYWANFQVSGLATYSYHAVNVLLHAAVALLLFFVYRRLLTMAGSPYTERRDALAAFGAAVYLLHPVQTESVAYVASRSENLSFALFLGAFTAFLYAIPAAVTWLRALAILALFGMAMLTKEHTVTLPAILLLTDLYFNPGFSLQGAKRNWRLYALMGAGALTGLAFLLTYLARETTVGFGMKEVSWHQYFFTQCRALFVYLRLFVLPVNLHLDYDFPISRTPLEHGAVFGIIGLAGLIAAAIALRKRFPLASYGMLAALILFAPTSSVVPIKDPIAERRLYLPMLGLVLAAMEFAARASIGGRRLSKPALLAITGAAAVVLGGMTYARAQVWSDTYLLWTDTVEKAPRNWRARFQLASIYYHSGQCAESAAEYARVASLTTPDHRLLLNWGLAEDCVGKPERALELLQKAVALENTAHANTQLAMVQAKMGRFSDAMVTLDKAQSLDPNFPGIYFYRGGVLLSVGRPREAVEMYRKTLALNPAYPKTREALAMAEQQASALPK